MTTTNKALLAALLENNEIATNESMVQFITDTLEAAGKKSGNKEHPNYIDDETGLEMKWCIRHEQYEDIRGWKVGTNGRLDASCDIAVGQWRALTKELKILEKVTMGLLGDAEKLQDHMMKVEAKKTERAGKYIFPEGATETKEAVIEEQEVIAPKKRKK